MYIRAAHAIRILGIKCPWGRTGATRPYETLPRTTTNRFFSSLILSYLSPSSRHAVFSLFHGTITGGKRDAAYNSWHSCQCGSRASATKKKSEIAKKMSLLRRESSTVIKSLCIPALRVDSLFFIRIIYKNYFIRIIDFLLFLRFLILSYHLISLLTTQNRTYNWYFNIKMH